MSALCSRSSFVAGTVFPSWVVFSICLSASAQSGLLAPGAEAERLAGGFKFTEGPEPDAAGDVCFSDIPNNRIHKWSVADRALTTFREDSGGANGLAFDASGRLLVCEGGRRRVAAIAPDGKTTVLADAHAGKKLNSPNDLWIDPRGGVYFTDPRYGKADDLEQDGQHVYYIAPDGKAVTRVCADLVKPNGVTGSADGKTLYVADHSGNKTWRYAIQADGALSAKTLFAEAGADGIVLDERGNLYLTGTAVTVYDPAGKLIETIEIPEQPSNVCFGGKDRKTLFVTARTSLYAVRMAVRGQ